MGNPAYQAQKKKAALIKQGYKPVEVKLGRGNQTTTVYQKTISRTDPSIADDPLAKALGGTVTKKITGGKSQSGKGAKPVIYASKAQEYAQIAKGTADIVRQMARQLLPNATEDEINAFAIRGARPAGGAGIGAGGIDINPASVIHSAATIYAKQYPDKFQYTPQMQSWVSNARGQLQGRSKDIWKSVSGGSESFGQAIAPYVGMAASVFAPGLGNFLSGGAAAGSAGAIAGGAAAGGLIGGGLSALQGGSFGQGMLSGAVSGGLGASGIGNTVGKAVGSALDVTSPITQGALNKGFTSGINSFAGGLVGGKDFGESLKMGALSGLGSGVSSYAGGNLMKAMGSAGVNKDLAGFLSGTAGGTAAGMIRGQDLRSALTNAAVGSAANSIGSMVGRNAASGNKDLDQMLGKGVGNLFNTAVKSALAPSPVQRPISQRPPTGMVSGQSQKQQMMAMLSRMPPAQRQALLTRLQGQSAPQPQGLARPTMPTIGMPTVGLPTMPRV